jgi:outer membrane protein TolC
MPKPVRRLPLFILLPALLAAQATSPIDLNLKRAVDMALAPDGNARYQLAVEAVKQAESRAAQARASLLPNLDAAVSDQSQTRNLASFGINIKLPIPGFNFPTFAGPFTTFDARVSATQSVFDFGAIRRYQASRTGVQAAAADTDAARDQVAAQVAAQYLAAIRAEARVEAARSDLNLAQSLLTLAANQKDAGTGTGIEVTRARVQLAQGQQQLLIAQNESRRAQLELLRTIGLPSSTPVRLTGKLAFVPADPVTPEKALEAALASRADWKAEQKRVETARLTYSGVKMERLPSVTGFADYGSNGTGIDNSVPTRTYGLSLRVPIFDGGRRDARRGESRSQYEQERIRGVDLRRQMELDVQLALDNLHSAEEQVQVASEGLKQSEAEMEQAQRRYRAGLTSSLEVTDSQTRLARARDNRIAALFLYNGAQLDLWRAMGTIRQMVSQGAQGL